MKRILSLLVVLIFIGATQKAEAKGAVVYHNGPTISKVADLPEDANIDGTHVNLAVMYEQFGLFWLPVWNYGDVVYVLINNAEDTYWDVDAELLQSIKTEYNLNIPDTPEIPFWTKVGLKPVLIILLIFMIWSQIRSKKED